MPRLVACHHCKILQRMPDVSPKTPKVVARLSWTSGEDYIYREPETGLPVMVPAYDPVLEDFVDKHSHGLPDDLVIGGLINVMAVDQKTWDTMDIVTQVKDQLKQQTNEWYDEKDEYKEEALKCYNRHNNPDLDTGCPDYMDEDRRIGPAEYHTEDGQTIRVPPKYRQYLCYVCPFQQTYIQTEIRRKRGAYR